MNKSDILKITDLSDEQLNRAIIFNQVEMDRLNAQLSEREYGYPLGWTETALKIGALNREKIRRINE